MIIHISFMQISEKISAKMFFISTIYTKLLMFKFFDCCMYLLETFLPNPSRGRRLRFNVSVFTNCLVRCHGLN